MEKIRTTVASRIALARLQLGLESTLIAKTLGISISAYDDLESYDHEAYECISLEQLCNLGTLLKVSPRMLVAPEGIDVQATEIGIAELVERIHRYLEANSLSTEQFEKQVGWVVSGVLEDPEAGWEAWNLDALQDICSLIETNWLAVIPNAPSRQNGLT